MTTVVTEPITIEEPPRRTRRKLWITLAVILGILVAALGIRMYQGFQILASGERVNIGDRHIFLSCSGTGSPTVILEHGLGEMGFDWQTVKDSIDDTTRVCYTSRAGMGFSDRASGDGVRTMQDAVDDLSAVLAAGDVPGPYVMVGHSAGGLSARLFADQHPNDVVGMVLVDTTHEDMTRRIRESISAESWDEVSGFFGSENGENMDLEASSAEVAAIGDLGDMPLVVLFAAQQENEDPPRGISQKAVDEVNGLVGELESELQADLATLSTNGTLVVVEDSGHFIHVDRPDAVIDAINSVLAG